ncbi:MAG: hypothetical protein AB7N71_10960 [Phycisphaerae bacterium]
MPQHRSLNFRFPTRAVLGDQHPRGEVFAQKLQVAVSRVHTISQPIDNWRDCGWEFVFTPEGEEYSCVLSVLDDDTTLIQVAPKREPNVVLRLFGQRRSATDAGIERRRNEFLKILRDTLRIENIAFAYDRSPLL